MAQTQNKDQGAFIPTTQLWDVTEIYEENVGNEPLKELLVRMYQNLNRMALSLNVKESGYYDTQEFVTGQQYFPLPGLNSSGTRVPDYRQTFRKVVNFGGLPNAGTTNVAHGINCDANTIFTRIYGVATDPTGGFSYLPLPYASTTLINNIELSVDGTNVTVITGIDRTAYTICYVICEYIKF
jgi:hypothetical protein